MSTKRINLISGPRNISTALMYSFGNRKDTAVVDEPMYAYYLNNTTVVHPGKNEILEALPRGIEGVKKSLLFQPMEEPYYFIKGMAHHYLDFDLSFLLLMDNVFLIRDPYKLILSYSKVMPNPTMQDIGIKKAFEIFQYLANSKCEPIVLDSDEVLKSPRKVLSLLCDKLDMPFAEEMLKWSAGPRKEDGVWGKYWYKNVHNSTGFSEIKRNSEKLSKKLIPLFEEARPYYDKLLEMSLSV